MGGGGIHCADAGPADVEELFMREIDFDTWLMIGVAWVHGLMCGYAIWRQEKRKPLEVEE